MMAGMWGADPEQLDVLASTMGRAGGRLSSIAREVHGYYSRDIWHGPDAQMARSQWESGLRQRLESVGRALRDCQVVLVRQAREQREASGVGPAASGGGDIGGVSPFNPYAPVAGVVGLLGGSAHVTEIASHLLGKAGRVGDYSDFYRTITGAFTRHDGVAVIPDFFRFKQSPVLQSLSSHLDSHAALLTGIHAVAGKAAGALGVVGTGLGVASMSEDFAQGKVSDGLIAGADTAAGVLKSSKSPVAYLAGAALSSVTMVADEARKADFSAQGLSLVAQEVARDPAAVPEELGKAAMQLPGMLWRVFT